MTTIEAYNYSVGFDTSRLESGGIITRRELNALRRDFRSLQSPADKSNLQINRLTEGLNKGAVGIGDYVAALDQIRGSMPEAIQRQRELADAQRDAASIRGGMITEDQRYAQEIQRVSRAVREGGLSMAEGREHMRSFKASQESTVQSTRELESAQRQAAGVLQGLKTETELMADKEAELVALFDRDLLTEYQLGAARKQLADNTSEAVAAAAELADAERQVQDIRNNRKSEDQLVADKKAELQSLVGIDGFTQKEATQELTDFTEGMGSAIAARNELLQVERDAMVIKRKQMTDEERYREELERVARMVKAGSLDRKQATAHLKSYKAALPQATAATNRLADAEREHAQLMRRGMEVTDRYTSADIKHARAIQAERKELEELYRAEVITQKIRDRGIADLNRRATRPNNPRQGMFSGVQQLPGIGGLAGSASQLAAMGPPLAALAVGIGGVTIAYRAGSAAARKFTGDMVEQAENIRDLQQRAELAGTSIQDLQAFQLAMQVEAGFTASQSAEMFTKLTTKIGEAAAGGGEALTTFQRLGLSAQELSLQDPSQSLREIVQSISEMPNKAAQSTAYMKLFEEQGVMAGRAFANGEKDLDRFHDQAKGLGLTISDAEAMGITRLTKDVEGLALAYDGLVNSALVSVAPALTVAVRDISELINQTRGFVTAMEASTATVANQLNEIDDRIAGAGSGLIGMQLRLADGFLLGGAGGYLAGLGDRSAEIIAENEQAAKAAKETYELKRAQAAELQRQAAAEKLLMDLKGRAAGMDANSLAATYAKLDGLNAQASAYEEAAKWHREIASRDQAAKIESLMRGTADELKALTDSMMSVELFGDLDKFDAADMAAQQQLRDAGASKANLEKNAARLADLNVLKREQEAMEQQKRHFERLKADAEAIKASMMSPAETLAEDIGRLTEMFEREELSAEQFAQAKADAARALLDVSNAAPSQSLGVSQAYDALVQDQQERQRIAMERSETERLIAAADDIAKHEAKRLQINERITNQMAEQARIAGNVVGGPVVPQSPGQSQTAPVQDDRTLDRIAEASEATASAIGQWQMVAV